MIKEFLEDIRPYVIVCGSYARYEETENSDIDCFILTRPEEEIDCELGNETYIDELEKICDIHDYKIDSVVIGHIDIKDDKMVEMSSLYKIPKTSKLFTRNILGVEMFCAVDDKNCRYEDCIERVEDFEVIK